MKAHGTALVFALLALPASASAQPGRFPIALPGRLGGGAAPTPAEREFSAGEGLLRQGDTAGARARFEAARRLDPRDPRPAYYLGEVSRRAERWAEAEGFFRDAIRLRATMAEAHASLGAVLREEGRLADAITALEAALRLSPTLGEAHYNLGLCLEDQGELARAINEYRRATQQLASDPMPALNLGLALAAQPSLTPAQRSQSLDAIREAVRRGSAVRDVLATAGPAFRQLGEARLAADTLERARTMGEPTATILGELAQALWVANDRVVAEQRMGEAITRAPREASLRYLHGLMLADAGQRARAVEEFRQAVTLGAGTPLEARASARLRAMATTAPRGGGRSPSQKPS